MNNTALAAARQRERLPIPVPFSRTVALSKSKQPPIISDYLTATPLKVHSYKYQSRPISDHLTTRHKISRPANRAHQKSRTTAASGLHHLPAPVPHPARASPWPPLLQDQGQPGE